AKAAEAAGRHVGVIGRSLRRIDETARENGYLVDLEPFLVEEEIGYLPDDKVLMICTGSQGERAAALSRIARNEHPQVTLGDGDTVVFSSRVIPGNERAIGRMQNDLIRRGVKVITDHDHFVHVSGHPGREEVTEMYGYVRPRIAVPMHGELRHMNRNAEVAQECGVSEVVIPEDGSLIRLAPGEARRIDTVPTGRLSMEGKRLVRLDGSLVRGRKRALWSGSVTATVVVDERGVLKADPRVTSQGLVDEDDADNLDRAVVKAIKAAIKEIPKRRGGSDEEVEDAVRSAVRKSFRELSGKRPVIEIHLMRI
ncbi:MAG: ribonuclease J, partial [Rhodospirillales bacterium]|nr:ribonuclease J [Rhodospirillales bacterium]MCW8970833.1 ribonuclease J [Rhodospirillales bacterium]